MSQWETVSVKYGDGSTESFTRFGTVEAKSFIILSQDCHFNEDKFILNDDVVDAYRICVSDTSDMGQINCVFDDVHWTVKRHEESLWTVYVNHGPSYDWKEDILAHLPDWVKVGGNWSWMDDKS